MDEKRRRELLTTAVGWLLDERRARGGWLPPRLPGPRADDEELWTCFRALVNTREPCPADERFLAAQDELLRGLIAERGVVALADAEPSPLDPRLRLVRCDITLLATDAIVNAANSGMTGCWRPLHSCIDNAIHTFAGVQLRRECAEAMERQGRPEPTAHARVTGAYNLPSRRVIHTVGPIAQGGAPTPEQRDQLARCYEACLDVAAGEGLASVAFCCISTGVFGFPQADAAGIAVSAVRRWLAEHPSRGMTVVFDVFLESDERLYRALLGLEG